ncbi:hypothetical protein DL96DRAFT_1810905, partial [Flagelloscypha sp. PMI_526]
MFQFLILLIASLAMANPITRRGTETNPAVTATTSLTALPTPPAEFNITSVDMNGTGCPPGTEWAFLNDEHTELTVVFSRYDASVGPGIPISENRKNCQLTFNVHVPSGFTFALVDIDYRGYYFLDTGVKVYRRSIYYFQGQLAQGESSATIDGPVDGVNIAYRDEFNSSPMVYAPCGQDSILNLNSQVRVDNSGNKSGWGYFAVDAAAIHTYNFAWFACP